MQAASRFPNSLAEGRICSQSAISADAGARYGANPNAKMERFAKPVILMAPLTPALSACSAKQWYGDGEPVGTENGKTVYSSTGSPRVGAISKTALHQCLKRAEIRCGGKTAYEVKAIRRTGTPRRENGSRHTFANSSGTSRPRSCFPARHSALRRIFHDENPWSGQRMTRSWFMKLPNCAHSKKLGAPWRGRKRQAGRPGRVAVASGRAQVVGFPVAAVSDIKRAGPKASPARPGRAGGGRRRRS
ncbi:hypothetical protein LV82_02478 [Albidovulum inexpectatum]|uniref:Uncharacterized protein n=1 Tax=Albidovulum inexpectatum TaxID=196587 RepID=A0A2S5JER9_9RHOB|nr:hypothetical protein LV82_02478 [Albidovulum inexpectatum]